MRLKSQNKHIEILKMQLDLAEKYARIWMLRWSNPPEHLKNRDEYYV